MTLGVRLGGGIVVERTVEECCVLFTSNGKFLFLVVLTFQDLCVLYFCIFIVGVAC